VKERKLHPDNIKTTVFEANGIKKAG